MEEGFSCWILDSKTAVFHWKWGSNYHRLKIWCVSDFFSINSPLFRFSTQCFHRLVSWITLRNCSCEPERVATPRKAVSSPIFFSKTSTPLLCFTLFQPELAKHWKLIANERKKSTGIHFTAENIERKN